MSLIARTIYRVHLEGLNSTERTVFGGLIHLAERNGTFFQVEAALENADIVILDGSDQRIVEFGRSHSQIAQRAIWIDPPSNLLSPRQLKRPLHWSILLDMMEQMVGRDRKAPVTERKPIMKMTLDQLCSLSEGILRMHIGVAAQFLVEDVRTEMKTLAGANEQVKSDIFLDILKQQLPTNADADKIILEISVAVNQAKSG